MAEFGLVVIMQREILKRFIINHLIIAIELVQLKNREESTAEAKPRHTTTSANEKEPDQSTDKTSQVVGVTSEVLVAGF